MGINADGNNVLLGRGKVYFEKKLTASTWEGERLIGNCTLFEITTNDELKDIFSSAEAASPLLKRVNVRRTVECSIEFSEMTKENLLLALMGTSGTQVIGAGSITDEPHIGYKDRYIQLGTSLAPMLSGVTGVVVTSDPAGTTYTVTTDYTVDAYGRVYIVPGGTIADAAALLIDYTKVAKTYNIVKAGISGIIEGRVKFIADPATGPKWIINVWEVQIAPDGAVGFISDEFATAKLKATVQAVADHSTETLYRATLID